MKTYLLHQVLIYKWTSLIAEFGGTLGLFLGFSFMTLWDGIFYLRKLMAWIKEKWMKRQTSSKINVITKQIPTIT